MIYSNLYLVTPGPTGTVRDYRFNPPQPEPTEPTKPEQAAPAAQVATTRKARKAKTAAAPTPTPITTSEAADDTAPVTDPSEFLGIVDGRAYRWFPDEFDMTKVGEQDPDIDFKQEVDLPEATRLALREQPRAKFHKREARKLIEEQVGDVLDLLADMGQLVEFAIIAASAYWADKAGLVPADENTIQSYGARGAAVLGFVSEGNLVLRSSFEAPEKMITTIMPRYSKVQAIVRDEYINPLKRFGL